MSTRLLPTAIEAEKCILSICLSKQQFLPRALEFIDSEHFADETNRRIFEEMKRLNHEDRPIETVTLGKASGVAAYRVGELIGYVGVADPQPY